MQTGNQAGTPTTQSLLLRALVLWRRRSVGRGWLIGWARRYVGNVWRLRYLAALRVGDPSQEAP